MSEKLKVQFNSILSGVVRETTSDIEISFGDYRLDIIQNDSSDGTSVVIDLTYPDRQTLRLESILGIDS